MGKTQVTSELHARLSGLTLRDEQRLRRKLGTASDISTELAAAEARVAARRAAIPVITYPDLPVSQRREDLLAAIRDNQVVIVAGETGSGKTTQLPKLCLELGRGVRGLIGHTQPRRLAARTVAERIAEELDTPLGSVVGYQVRFTEHAGENTLVKLMTDGILLAEIQHDRQLRRYDTLIIDEAHERSLNIDFILGYLKQLLPRRPDLKVIITSATIDPERFAAHFENAPIVEVSGRTYPVEMRYRPVVDLADPDADPDRDQVTAIADAVGELRREGPGDILVFLSGEREIRDTADALNALELRNTEVLPLYARLSIADQHRVFQPHAGTRVVLATNVAETSLTVPGIKYVIDPGTARISRYSHRLKVQRLPIEPVSQASANQRAGRCGRTSDGVCIRLYAEEDYLSRPEFTDPEILRTNLASVILQMAAAGLGQIEEFPFLDAPDRRQISDGLALLHELGALDSAREANLTKLGRKLAVLPLDPRLARMVLEADRNGCVREVMVIASALSIQDPRERPTEARPQADAKHARFADPDSDFGTYLNLWRYLREQQKALSSNQFRRLCKAEYLNYLRIREWQDIDSQLRSLASTIGVAVSTKDATPQQIHTSLLSGLLSHIGLRDVAKKDYLGARNGRFAIFPGSAVARKQPRWVMAAELVETSRLWGRAVARIEPEWIEPLAGHLVKRTYSEPHWEAKQGAAMAIEKVTLYGLPIVVSRKVNFGRIDPETSRALFIRHALVEGDWTTRHRFFAANRALLDQVEELENRVRRRDIRVDDQALFEFYDKRVPAEVVSARHFDRWWRDADKGLLDFEPTMLVNAETAVSEQDFPDERRHGELSVPLSYHFEPGAAEDGVTAHIPLTVLNKVSGDAMSWQVPGLRAELVTALIRSLPKNLRRNFVPAPDVARAVLDRLGDKEATPAAVAGALTSLVGVVVAEGDLRPDQIPDHLKATFRIVDDNNRTVAQGKDLGALKHQLRQQVLASLSSAAHDIEQRGLTDWTIGTLPRTVERQESGFTVTAYPALTDEGKTVGVRMFDTPVAQRESMVAGTRRLLLLTVPPPAKTVIRALSNQSKLTLSRNPHGGVGGLLDDCVAAATDSLAGDLVWDAAAFAALRDTVRAKLAGTALDVVHAAESVLTAWHTAEAHLGDLTGPAVKEAAADIRAQLDALIYAGFVTETGASRLPDLTRYLRAVIRRIEKLPGNVARDEGWMWQVAAVEDTYYDAMNALPPGRPPSPELREIRWMIEELRVSYFAQDFRTPYPVSDKRVLKALAAHPS